MQLPHRGSGPATGYSAGVGGILGKVRSGLSNKLHIKVNCLCHVSCYDVFYVFSYLIMMEYGWFSHSSGQRSA